jgi:hypothetical protein
VPYWIRVFCTEESPPILREILDWAAARGITLDVDRELTPDVNLDSPEWAQVAIRYHEGKLPFLSEVTRRGDPDLDIDEEIEEFVEFLEDVPDWPAKQKVLDHLGRTSFIVGNQIPTSDFDDEGYNAVGEFNRYFVANHGGMIQADGEGFYEDDTLIVDVE